MDHILYSVEEVLETIEAKVIIENTNAEIRTLLTDSRKLVDIRQALFFALLGRRDGHSYIYEVYKAGVRNFVISVPDFNCSTFPNANFFIVKDTLIALQKLAAYHRSKFNYPVVAITGSNGKTIVKEWLHQLLTPEHNIIRSPKSYNSQIGVPISVWEMNEGNDLAIFEAGISKNGEMPHHANVIKPTIGILTNIGEAHNEGFASREEKIAEKLKLFKGVDLFIYPADYLNDFTGEIPGKTKFSWSYQHQADLEISWDEVFDENHHIIHAKFEGKEVQCYIPFTESASIENAIICWATLLALGYKNEVIVSRLEKLLPVKMRLELKTGINNCSIIDDSYSLDLSSLAIALDFLKQQNQHSQKTLILSDIPGEGLNQEQLYQNVAGLLESKSVNRLIGVGERIARFSGMFKMEAHFYKTTDELLENLSEIKLANETILLKGARLFTFEKISKALTQKVHETILEINLNALEHNLNYYKSQLKEKVKLMAVVKAFSYGSGSFEIANLLEFNKVDYLAVAYADEGVSLRKAAITLPIMVMSPDVMAFDTMIENKLEPEIYSLRIFNEFVNALNRKNIRNYPVHLKLDTGMHRLGFMEAEFEILLDLIQTNTPVKIQSVFSHLVASDNKEYDDFTRQQINRFNILSERIEDTLDYPFIRHLANTSAICRWPDSQFDMVRLGIGLYGINNTYPNKSPLQTVTSLKTSISQIKEIAVGGTVGYSPQGVMKNGGKVATVKIGYADGYSRALGNGVGKMLINNKLVPTIGKICMDMSMLDITGLDVAEEDEVIVFNEHLQVEEIAEILNTIPYEILTGISQRVKRIYYYE